MQSTICILPLVCGLYFTLSLHFIPDLQSAVCILHWTFSKFLCVSITTSQFFCVLNANAAFGSKSRHPLHFVTEWDSEKSRIISVLQFFFSDDWPNCRGGKWSANLLEKFWSMVGRHLYYFQSSFLEYCELAILCAVTYTSLYALWIFEMFIY